MKDECRGLGEAAQPLQAWAALEENAGSVPSTHTVTDDGRPGTPFPGDPTPPAHL